MMLALFFQPAWAQEPGSAVEPSELRFQVHVVNRHSEFPAAAVMDVDEDGAVDIVSGSYWYRAPSWEPILFRGVPQIRGRYDDYSNLPYDVDGDGHLDLISANYRSATIYWIRNPFPAKGLWSTFVLDRPGRSETALLADVDGDGEIDLLPNGVDYTAWYQRVLLRVSHRGVSFAWLRHGLPAELRGHGIGCGDLNGDGLPDVVGQTGWARQRRELGRSRWEWRPDFRLSPDASIPILICDVDRDGDQDLIWARGHQVGLYWAEQVGTPEGPCWRRHTIDSSVSQFHTLQLADLDGNGHLEVIGGKRFLGHDGRDVGEYDPPVVCRYSWIPQTRSWNRDTLSWGSVYADLNLAVVDIDRDGDQDLVAPSRAGLFWLENVRVPVKAGAGAGQGQTTNRGAAPNRDLLTLEEPDGSHRPIGPANRLDWGRRRYQILAAMEQVLGPMPASCERVPLDGRVLRRKQQGRAYEIWWIEYRATLSDRVPALLLLPKDRSTPRPAMLCLHQTVRVGKAEPAGLAGDPNLHYAAELAQRGYVCLAPDYPGFGDDSSDPLGGGRYASGLMRAIWNNIRGLDLLQSLPEVDEDRLGAIGHSLGGHTALFTAAFDQRLRAIVTSCGFTSFRRYFGGDLRNWAQPHYMPRIGDWYQCDPKKVPFDFHEVLAAVAPRPVFISAPLRDHNFDHRGVVEVAEVVRRVYQLFGAEESLRLVAPDCGHTFPHEVRAQVYDWLERILRP
jgi:hypothetical protein